MAFLLGGGGGGGVFSEGHIIGGDFAFQNGLSFQDNKNSFSKLNS